MNLLQKNIALFLVIFGILNLLIGCSEPPTTQPNNSEITPPRDLNFYCKHRIDSSYQRFQIVNIAETNPVSQNVLLDTCTGETWQLYWSDGSKSPLTGKLMGKNIWWKKMTQDNTSQFDDFKSELEAKTSIEEEKQIEPSGEAHPYISPNGFTGKYAKEYDDYFTNNPPKLKPVETPKLKENLK